MNLSEYDGKYVRVAHGSAELWTEHLILRRYRLDDAEQLYERLGTEALKTVLEYLTENEGIYRVTAWCAVDNIGSLKVLEKSGMQLVGIELALLHDDVYRDE